MKGKAIRILILEDNPSDTELMVEALKRAGFDATWERVETEQDFAARLTPELDLILSDYGLPRYNGLEALRLTRTRGLDVPFILVSGTVGEDIAVEAIRAGADDYLLKDRLSRLGPAVEMALDRRRLREEARQAERALRESETKFRELIEQASDGIFVTDEQGSFLLANPKYCEMLGYDESELRRLNVAVTFPEEERAAFSEQIAKLKETGSRLLERTLRRKDGSRFPAEVSMRILSNGTHQGILRDITERKRAADELRESEVKFRGLIEQASDGIFVTDARGNFRLVNSRFCEMLGYSEQDLLRLNAADTYIEAETALFAQRLATLGEVGSRMFEREVLRADGSLLPVEVSIRRLGTGLNQGIVRDITGRKEAARALGESEERFRQMAENMRDIFFLVDLKTGGMLYMSPAYEKIWGRSRDPLYADSRSWTEAIHAEDHDRVLQQFEEQRTTGRFDSEYRIIRPDGDVRWIHTRTFSISDESGNPYRSVGIGEDITERKEAEKRIQNLARVQSVLSGINALIVRVRDREDLFQGSCRIAVENGKFGMAWIGDLDPATLEVTPVAWAGMEGEVTTMKASARSDIPEGRGMVGRAIRDKSPVITNDIRADPGAGGPRRVEAMQRGFQSIIALPLMLDGEVTATLTLFATERDFFSEDEMKLLAELAGDISFALEHIDRTERLDYLAYYDALTGIANRKLLLERLDQRIRTAAEKGDRLALTIVDIERFKNINDTLGRQGGDQVLKALAGRFLRFLADPDRVGRVLGDQFGIIIPDALNESTVARRVDQKMRECISVPIRLGESELRISAKAGIALYPDDGADADTLFRNAEAALKRAKAAGEHYLFYTQQMTERVGLNLALENKLRQALENDEFVLHFQPKVDTVTRGIEGVEALIRWQSRDLGLVPPMHFIPLLEETGLILEVGAWALRRAARDYRRWSEQGLNAPRIAVNVSAIQLRRRDFVETTIASIETKGGPAAIDVEVTESLIMENIEVNVEKFEALRRTGMEISIDDFGTGYSSLGYLAKLPVQVLKIDRSFIVAMLNDPAVMTLVSTIVTLAHTLKLKVVAEGVETEDQASALKRLGCDQLQGFLISKALPFDEVAPLLGSRA